MGLDFLDDRRDGGGGFDHGRVHLIAEGLKRSPLLFGRRLSGLMSFLHGLLVGFFLLGKARIGRDGGIVGLFQLGFFGVRQEVEVVMMTAGTAAFAGRRRRWAILGFKHGRTRDERAQRKEKKYSFHVIGRDSMG